MYIYAHVHCISLTILLQPYFSAANQMPSLPRSDAGYSRQAYCPRSHSTNLRADSDQRAWCTHGCTG